MTSLLVLYVIVGISFAIACFLRERFPTSGTVLMAVVCGLLWPVILPFTAVR